MSSISAADDVLAAQLGDLAPERVQRGWPPRELGDRGDASHAPRCRLDRHAHACPLGLQHERPVAAGGGLEGRDSTAGPERDVVDRAERVVAGAEEKGAGAVLARLDHQVGRIVDEDVREAAALAQDRHQARQLVHQRVDGADLAPRDLDHEADAARPAARAAVGVAAVRELGERGVEHEARRRARHRRTCASRQHHARCLIVSRDRGHASSNRRRRAKVLPPTVGETRVDLLHLLEDLRDAYPGALEETILTEIVANALDSGASRISMVADPTTATFTAADDGSGMKRRELARYHDVAASTKTRGEGIGFAGVGIKLGLLVCEEVLTETRRGKTHVATRWHLASRHRAPWKWLPPPGLAGERGTAVRLKLRNALSPLVDTGFNEAALRRNYQPLLDPTFDAILAAHYPRGVSFEVNGRGLERQGCAAASAASAADACQSASTSDGARPARREGASAAPSEARAAVAASARAASGASRTGSTGVRSSVSASRIPRYTAASSP